MTSFVVLILTIALLVMLSGYLSVGEAAISSVSAAKAQAFGEDNPKMAPIGNLPKDKKSSSPSW